MTEKDEKLAIEALYEAAGGEGIQPDNEQWLNEHGYRIAVPKYRCPQCGSRNVINYDPDTFLQMRVKCNDCGYWGCRGSISDTKM